MADPIRCPSCAVPMDEMPATPPEGAPVTVDVCSRCGGLWLDPNEIAVVVPQLEVVKDLASSLGTGARRGTGIPACPRCFEAPVELNVLGLVVDHCTSCGGIWLDGDEHTGFSQESDRLRGLAAPGPTRGAYRTAAKAAQTGLVLCSSCGSETPLARTYMAPGGAICPSCHAVGAIREKDREVREQVTIGRPDVPMADRLHVKPLHDDRDMPVWVSASLNPYTKALLTILHMLDEEARCPVCACSRYSRCGH